MCATSPCSADTAQVLEIWKILLDPDTMEGAVEKNRFLDLFYEGCIGTLTETLAESALPKVRQSAYVRNCCAVTIAWRARQQGGRVSRTLLVDTGVRKNIVVCNLAESQGGAHCHLPALWAAFVCNQLAKLWMKV